MYDVEPYSLCKLVDALSGGEVLKYLDLAILFGHWGLGCNKTVSDFVQFINTKLDVASKESIFGKVRLDSLDDWNAYFTQGGDFYKRSYVQSEFERYLLDHYDFNGKAFTRKQDS